MSKIVQQFNERHASRQIPEVRSGDTVRVTQRIKEGDKTRLQAFEGLIISIRHGKGINGMMTVRKISFGVGVERTFPFHAPTVEKIELLRRAKVRRAKLFYVRYKSGKKARKMRGELVPPVTGVAQEQQDEAQEEK